MANEGETWVSLHPFSPIARDVTALSGEGWLLHMGSIWMRLELESGNFYASFTPVALVAVALQTTFSSLWRAWETLSASPKRLCAISRTPPRLPRILLTAVSCPADRVTRVQKECQPDISGPLLGNTVEVERLPDSNLGYLRTLERNRRMEKKARLCMGEIVVDLSG
jgi:hypothetical protein